MKNLDKMLWLKDPESRDIVKKLTCLWSPLILKNSPLILHKLVIWRDCQISYFYSEDTSLTFKGLFEMDLSEGTKELTALIGRFSIFRE